MSVFFDVTAANAYLSFTAGSAGAIGSAGYTMASLIRIKSGNNNAAFVGGYVSGSANRVLFASSVPPIALFGNNDFSSGFGSLSTDTWYVVAQSKATGSNMYRHHVWQYAADGSGSFSHGVATGSSNQGDGSAVTELRIGGNVIKGNGDIAVSAFWTRACSDTDIDALKTNLLSAWLTIPNGGPAECQHFRDWNGTTGAVIAAGTSSFSSQTGTSAAGANPPSFDFSLSAAMGQQLGLTQAF